MDNVGSMTDQLANDETQLLLEMDKELKIRIPMSSYRLFKQLQIDLQYLQPDYGTPSHSRVLQWLILLATEGGNGTGLLPSSLKPLSLTCAKDVIFK